MNIEFTARGVLSVFFRKTRTIKAVFSFVVLMGLIYIIFAPPVYEETGSLLVKFGREGIQKIVRSEIGDIPQNDRREIMESNMQILKSHDLLQGLVQEFGPEKLYPGITAHVSGNESPVEAAVKGLRKRDLSIISGSQSYIIEVRLLNENPEVAAEFVRRLIESFIRRQSEMYNNPETTLLNDQVRQATERLKHSQQELQDFKAKVGVSSIDEELVRLIQEKGDAETIAFQSVDDAKSDLMELKAQESTMLATYKANSPAIQQIREKVALAEQQLNERQGDLKAPSSQSPLQGKKSGILASHVVGITRKIDWLEQQRSHLNDLARQVSIDEETYKNYMIHNEEARLNETLNKEKVTQISVLDEPVVETIPARPRRLLIMALCLLGGIVASLCVALVSQFFDERISTPEQLADELELPVMAVFSVMARK